MRSYFTSNARFSGAKRPRSGFYRLAVESLEARQLLAVYQVIDLGVDVSPTDINNSETVVGSRVTEQSTTVAFRYTPSEGLVDLVGGRVANGVNDNEQIAGNTETGAFLYSGGKLKDLGDNYAGNGVNETGKIVGSKSEKNPYRPVPRPLNPAIYDIDRGKWDVLDIARVYPRGTRQGVYADLFNLTDINDSGFAVGRKSRYGLAGSSAILTTPDFSDVTYLPTPYGGYASAINNQNKIVGATGTNSSSGNYSHAYLYELETGDITDLGTLNDGLTSTALDINELDQVVGSSWLVTQNTSLYDPEKYHAFIWEDAQMTDLNTLIPDGVDDPPWIITSATAINERGDIVGVGFLDGQSHGVLLTADAPTGTPPAASFTTDTTRLTVNFADTSTGDGMIVLRQWDFGDGSSSTEINVSHTYRKPGTYTATLVVTDDDGLTDTALEVITVTKRNAKASGPIPAQALAADVAIETDPVLLATETGKVSNFSYDGGAPADSATVVDTSSRVLPGRHAIPTGSKTLSRELGTNNLGLARDDLQLGIDEALLELLAMNRAN